MANHPNRKPETTVANNAATSLRWRLGGSTEAPVTDDMIKVAAWFYCHADNTHRFKEAFIASLGLEFYESPMGDALLRRRT